MPKKQVVLCILDGWGLTDDIEYSAIARANTSFYDSLLRDYPNTRLGASGLDVGLPDGQMGNSEVGHTTIGSGRVVFQDLPRISGAVARGELADNDVLNAMALDLEKIGSNLHLLGLLSDGGVHSHIDHIVSLAKVMAGRKINVFVHAFLDGRDTPQKSALLYLKNFIDATKELPNIRLATVGGRYYGMDRDKNWDRVAKAYSVIVDGNYSGSTGVSPMDIVNKSYGNGVTDEFVEPTAVDHYDGMRDGDAFVFCNFRADRARELSQALGQRDFNLFERRRVIKFSCMAQLTEYSAEHSVYLRTIFPSLEINESLGEIISGRGMKQLRIAETEKYAHVTFFFNGGVEKEFEGEDRILIKSPSVATYDLKPEMSCLEVNGKLMEAIESNKYDLMVVNFANPDMVGHTGNMEATVKAIETVDQQLSRLVGVVRRANGTIFITADHGNAEKMFDVEKNQPHTAHTTNDVPFIVVKNNIGRITLRPRGTLADVAPTILDEFGIGVPKVFSGMSLMVKPR
ncbi:MAG: 2,3-bisphosphoglycerate-independent phosphoglycerate mutase [Rickettsiales bacterium]|jgi:2,3-bisphosphoglycerate-independent phosphoglycerate mutase|nr:2,3-bisphosphoglycerate-independent phosphoglycerate mutase [Rickettsiales bacterium]